MQDDEKPVRRDHRSEQDRLDPEVSGSRTQSELGARFVRRWDQVQTAFVARGSRGDTGSAGHPSTTAT